MIKLLHTKNPASATFYCSGCGMMCHSYGPIVNGKRRCGYKFCPNCGEKVDKDGVLVEWEEHK